MKIIFAMMGCILWTGIVFGQAKITTNPASHLIHPDADLVETTFTLPSQSSYKIVIRTPPSHWWISTDFPIVEDTQLYALEGYTETGLVQFQTLYPMRGDYPIEVTVNGKVQNLVLSVNETPAEVNYMWIMLAVFFVLGVLGGQIFLRSSQAQTAMASLAIFFVLLMSPNQFAQAHHSSNDNQVKQWSQTSGGYTLEVTFDASHAVAGESVEFDIQVKKGDVLLQTPVTLEIDTFHMEDETTMFKGQFTAQTGQMKQTLQFFDGAETRTTFKVVSLDNVALSTSDIIDVEGIAPPSSVIIKTMISFSLVVLGGLAIGFFFLPGKKITREAV